MKAWVVAKGEYAEGHTPVIAFAEFTSAREYIVDKFGGIPVFVDQGRWRTKLAGCDEVWIYCLEVHS